MDRDIYINLIHKQLTEELTSDELQALEAYLSSDTDHQRLADEIRLSWELGEAGVGIPDVDIEAELGRMHQRMDSTPAAQNGADEVRLTPPSKGKVTSMIMKYMAIAASILAVIAAGMWLFDGSSIGGIDDVQTIVARNGTKTIDLADGSKIWLRDGSSIKYAKSNAREISLTGQAFFEVERDELRPFTVTIDETFVTVLGTSFEVSGGADGSIEVHVATGKVSMSNEYGEVILEKGNGAIYEPKDRALSKIDFDDPYQEPWKSGRFIFKNQTLSDIIAEVEDYYGVQIAISNEVLANCRKTASTPVKSTNEVIQAIAKQFQLSVRKIEDTLFILDGDQCQ